MFELAAFWLGVLATGLVVRALPQAQLTARAIAMSVVSLAVLIGLSQLDPAAAALLAGVVAWTVLAGRWMVRSPHVGKYWLLFFAPVLVAWLSGKFISQSVGVSKLLTFVGFSYVLIKALTLLKDIKDGRIPDYNVAVGIAYFAFFPTFISGPVHLYSEFEKTLGQPYRLEPENILDIALRALWGLVKIRVVAPLFTPLSLIPLAGDAPVEPRTLLIASVCYYIVLYADFSGYSDVAIAAARLCGVATPENFQRPYAARNLREFWQRWHISFSRILTSYLFIPISRSLERILGDRPRVTMVASYLLVFAACGYWHGPSANFLLWGVFHGVGLACYDLVKSFRKRRKRAPLAGRARLVDGLVTGVSVGATFLYVSLGWVLFALPLSRLGWR